MERNWLLSYLAILIVMAAASTSISGIHLNLYQIH
ncbi:hypothetical protein Golob_000918 [Gossypium lobatum]|uniref:Uncharacterized protein n=1 Tax=Gossypium lobatum TaxID=34289 RepID=A0A7J8N9X5_9ROSI|nr:hypothetical protein [Gossypium lobatum]